MNQLQFSSDYLVKINEGTCCSLSLIGKYLIQKSINKVVNVDKSIRTEVAVKNKDKKEIVSETTQTHVRRNKISDMSHVLNKIMS